MSDEILITMNADTKVGDREFKPGDLFDPPAGALTERQVASLKNINRVLPLTRENYARAIARRPAGTVGRGFTEAYLIERGIIDPPAAPAEKPVITGEVKDIPEPVQNSSTLTMAEAASLDVDAIEEDAPAEADAAAATVEHLDWSTYPEALADWSEEQHQAFNEWFDAIPDDAVVTFDNDAHISVLEAFQKRRLDTMPAAPVDPDKVVIKPLPKIDDPLQVLIGATPFGAYFIKPKKAGNFTLFDVYNAEGKLLREKAFRSMEAAETFLTDLSTGKAA